MNRSKLVSRRRPLAPRIAMMLTFAGAFASCTSEPQAEDAPLESLDGQQLQWVAPLAQTTTNVGDAVELAVFTTHAAAGVIHFEVDGQEVGACDPADAELACHEDQIWHWAVSFDAVGEHTIAAWFNVPGGDPVRATRVVYALAADATGGTFESGSETEVDPVPESQRMSNEPTSVVQAEMGNRGHLDPPHAFHRKFGSQEWKVQSQRVILRDDPQPMGSVTEIARCVEYYGASLRRNTDLRFVSRASVAAALAITGACGSPQDWDPPARLRPLVRPATCAALMRRDTPSLSATECGGRLRSTPDFAISVLARYLGQASARRVHHGDPPLTAAFLANGDVRRSSRGPWNMRAPSGYIQSYVRAYNAYRTWEQRRDALDAMVRRVVFSRMYQNGRTPVEPPAGVTVADHVAATLARLQPTMISGLVRFGIDFEGRDGMPAPSVRDAIAAALDHSLTPAILADIQTIRTRLHVPLEIDLNAQDFGSPAKLEAAMQAISDRLRPLQPDTTRPIPEVWYFDFYQPVYAQDANHRRTLQAGIEWAHRHGAYIGGNTWSTHIPPGSDFVSLPDHPEGGLAAGYRRGDVLEGEQALTERMRELATTGLPLLLHNDNDPQFAPDTESCYFMGQCGAGNEVRFTSATRDCSGRQCGECTHHDLQNYQCPQTSACMAAPMTYSCPVNECQPACGPDLQCDHPEFSFRPDDRAQYLSRLAAMQGTNNIRFMYPAFFPICNRPVMTGTGVRTDAFVYDPSTDVHAGGTMLDHMVGLMRRHNGLR